MEYRILTKLSGLIVGLLFGIPIGCMTTIAIIGAAQHLKENPRVMKFGDITISAITQRDANDQFAEELLMTKDGNPFLWASRNSLGKVTDLSLANGKEEVILTLKASHEPSKWISARYGSSDLIGESYQDTDFDGHFDIKVMFDSNVKALSRYIYFNGIWKQVDGFQKQKAFLGSDVFIFHIGSGWQLVETGNNGGHQTKR